MARRIALWALVGFAVASAWVVLVTLAGHAVNVGRWTILRLTAPAALLGLHHPQKYYWFMVENAMAYACAGLAVELGRSLWRRTPRRGSV